MKKTLLTTVALLCAVVGMFALTASANDTSKAQKIGAANERRSSMKPMHYFLDTHDRTKGTFPAQLTREDFEGFFAKFEEACYEEGVVPVRLHVSYTDGRAFCLLMASDADAVKRAHDRVGLPFDSITEVTTATPGDTFFRRP